MNEHSETVAIKSVAQLIDQYQVGVRSFTGATLSQSDLQGITLRGADLSYADLSQANLQAANLRGADLSYADLEQANLQDADLRGTLLLGTNFRDVDLSTTLLQDADYDHTTHFPNGFDPVKAGLHPKVD
jgi:uncharacterized protein YjbI with pentapeptide repeats